MDVLQLLSLIYILYFIIKVILAEQSIDLSKYFSCLSVLEHEGGHYLPATGQPKLKLQDFLTQMQEICFK